MIQLILIQDTNMKKLLIGLSTLSALFCAQVFAAPIDVKCGTDKVRSAWVAKSDYFSVQEGLSNKNVDGFTGRKQANIQGCSIGHVKAGDAILLLFNNQAKTKLKYHSNYEMQCVDASKPNGKFLGYDASPVADDADGKSWTPPCQASNLNASEKAMCSKDSSNRGRQDSFKSYLQKNKLYAMEVMIQGTSFMYTIPSAPVVGSNPTHTTAAQVAPSGKLFCQYWSKKDKNVVFSLTFDIPK